MTFTLQSSGNMAPLPTTFKGEKAEFLFSALKCVFSPEAGAVIEWDNEGLGLGWKTNNPGKKDTFSGKKIRVPSDPYPNDLDTLNIIRKLPDTVTDFRTLILLSIVYHQYEKEAARTDFSVAGELKNDLKNAFRKAEMGIQAQAPNMLNLDTIGDTAYEQGLIIISHMLLGASYFIRDENNDSLNFERATYDPMRT